MGEQISDGRSHRKRDPKDGHANLAVPFLRREDVHEPDLHAEHLGQFGFDLPSFHETRTQLHTNPSPFWTMRLGRSGHETRFRGSLDDRSPRTFKG